VQKVVAIHLFFLRLGTMSAPKTTKYLQSLHDNQLIGTGIAALYQGGLLTNQAVVGLRAANETISPNPVTLPVYWQSGTKPLVAALVLKLCEQGFFTPDTRVQSLLPRFEGGGKEAITIAHLLTHQAGLRSPVLTADSFDALVEKIYALAVEQNWSIGHTAGYHVQTSWYILGAIIEKLLGISLQKALEEHIFSPLAMQQSTIEPDATGQNPPVTLYASKSRSKTYTPPSGSPAAGLAAPIEEMARFYTALINGGIAQNGERILSEHSAQLLSTDQRQSLTDTTFRCNLRWSYGCMLNSQMHNQTLQPYSFGSHASTQSFGHGGRGSSLCFADPQNNCSVFMFLDTIFSEAQIAKHTHHVCTALYEDAFSGGT